MAISIEDTKTGSANSTGTTLAPVFAGANTGCIVAVAWQRDAGASTVSAMTCDGNAMTLIAAYTGSNNSYLSFYKYIGSLAGAKNVVFTLSNACYWAMAAFAMSGLNTLAPIKESQGTGGTTNVTLNFTAADPLGIIITGDSAYYTTTDPTGYTSVINDANYRSILKKTSGVVANESIYWAGGGAWLVAGAISLSPCPPVSGGNFFWWG